MAETPQAVETEQSHSPERNESIRVMFLGRLGDFNLGNEDGIPTRLKTKEQVEAYAEDLKKHVVRIDRTKKRYISCIDGRECEGNADGSEPEVRGHMVGGTESYLQGAYNGEADIVATVPSKDPEDPADRDPSDVVHAAEEYVEEAIGIRPSSHLGECGGANGEVDDAKAVAENNNIGAFVETVMAIPAIQAMQRVDFSPPLMERIRSNSERLHRQLTKHNWSGARFVEDTERSNPRGVEKLKVGDDRFYGHQEDAFAIVVGEEHTIICKDAFEIDVCDIRDSAHALGGSRGLEGITQVTAALWAKHAAVADRLASKETPLILVVIE